MTFWFRRKYQLSPRDPRFLELSLDEIWAEWWAHQFADDPRAAEDEHTDDDFDLDVILAKLEQNPEEWETIATYEHQDPR